MTLRFREVVEDDLPLLVDMLADDELGAQREDKNIPLNQDYVSAFQQIVADPNNELIVVEQTDQSEAIVGMLQLTFIPYLTYIGSWRCLIEGVRIHRAFRGHGFGTQFFTWAIERAKERGCHMVQLTSDKQRPDAIRFYESLGFVASHEGFKLKLEG
ncbi:MAG: GNAT family N-acetyltransferase [Chloroflexota bacterium]